MVSVKETIAELKRDYSHSLPEVSIGGMSQVIDSVQIILDGRRENPDFVHDPLFESANALIDRILGTDDYNEKLRLIKEFMALGGGN